MNKFKVPIQNILFIYSYVWEKANKKDLIELDGVDEFSSTNIYAELFLINIETILKKGLYKMYIEKNEELRGIKGKIDFKNSINHMSFFNSKAYCIYDELEIDNIFNQIIKTTALKLSSLDDLMPNLKKRLNNILLYFNQVSLIYITKKNFADLYFIKDNMYYYMMIKICELINDNLILSDKKGKYKFINLFEDESNFNKIFELFINRFYKEELKDEYKVYYHTKKHWNILKGNLERIPLMEFDTILQSKEETIIIDTKYYKEFYNNRFDKIKYKSEHLYQMSSYLNNYNCSNNLRGIIIYPMPKTREMANEEFTINIVKENKVYPTTIKIVTIDLSQKSNALKEALLNIIHEK